MPKVKKCMVQVGTRRNGRLPLYCGMPLVNGKCPEHGSNTGKK